MADPGELLAARIEGLLEELLRQARSPFKESLNDGRIELGASDLKAVVGALRVIRERQEPAFRERLAFVAVHLAENVNLLGRLLPCSQSPSTPPPT